MLHQAITKFFQPLWRQGIVIRGWKQSVRAQSTSIHPTSIVHPGASIASDVTIGPFCIIDKGVALGRGVKLHSHVVVSGTTQIGNHTNIFPFSCVGNVPQDLKYKGEDSRLVIGEGCIIRENVTINIGTQTGGGLTKIGDRVLLMTGTHVAHDCQIGNNVILSNNVHLAGHVTVDDHAIIGGHCGVHQYSRIGTMAMVGGMSGVVGDVIPYGLVKGNRASLHGLNLIGLRRRKYATSMLIELMHVSLVAIS
eukprot:TRINITY_DN6512_c0_g2_i4.p1 TRINITY_DN6512_c0_g2~~TRINITY_DN6512_c0_g2_i4.p1  ORF type:complete len:251 (+),score=26.02 TRINITY_DN6512_c0_g2_i4:50-802(+)